MKKFLNFAILILIFSVTPLLPGEGQGVRASFACSTQTYYSPADDVESVILSELAQAKKSIHVAAYALTDSEIADRLIELHKRGVEVVVYLDKTQASRKLSKDEELRAAGVTVIIKKGRYLMHDKYIIIDRRTVITGSYNFSESARRQDNNVVVLEHCLKRAREYEADFGRLTGR